MVNGGVVAEDMESKSVFSCRLVFSEGALVILLFYISGKHFEIRHLTR
jgi:hypothetical protein